jgi:hypothetical protein
VTITLKNPYLLFQYLWILVLCPKELQFFLLLIYVILINTDDLHRLKYYPDTLFVLMLSFSVIHMFSIIINAIFCQTEPVRIAAAFNTALIWIIAAFAYSYFKNHKVKLERICRLSCINLLILIGLACLSLICFYILKNSDTSIFGIDLYGIDWFKGKPHLRFKGGMEYNNLVVILYVLLLPLAFSYLKQKSRVFSFAFLLASFIPVILSLSRSGYLIISTAYLLVFLLCKGHKRKDYLLLAVFIVVFLGLLFMYAENIKDIMESLIFARTGSNHTRMQIYFESVGLTLKNSPIWGMGIKHISESGYPLGSHSTYIGVFYKTGIGGTFVFAGILTGILKILLSRKENKTIRAEAIFIFMLFLEFLFEDMDGADWVIVLLFSVIGIIGYKENQYELQKSNELG